MLTVRIGGALDAHAREIADLLATRITGHALASALHGTVLIGTGGTRLIRADDARPRVIVPLPGMHALGALALEQISIADAVVVRDVAEASRLRDAIGTAPVVVAGDVADDGAPFLVGATAQQTAEAWDAVDDNPELRDCLRAIGRHRTGGLSDELTLIAHAVTEAVIACDDRTSSALPPGTRG